MIAYKFHIDIFRHSIKSYKTYWLGFSIANNFVIPTDLVQIMSFILQLWISKAGTAKGQKKPGGRSVFFST